MKFIAKGGRCGRGEVNKEIVARWIAAPAAGMMLIASGNPEQDPFKALGKLFRNVPSTHSVHAQEYEMGSNYVLVEILPDGAVELVKRADRCVHWQGEEGLDDERKQQIQEAIIRFKCHDLVDYQKMIESNYKYDVTVTKALNYLKMYYGRPDRPSG